MTPTAPIDAPIKHYSKYRRNRRLRYERTKETAREVGLLLAQTLSKVGLNPRIKFSQSSWTGSVYMKVQLLGPDGQQVKDAGAAIRVSDSEIRISMETWNVLGNPDRTVRQIEKSLRRKGGVK